ncbi:MAG: NUDIX hydrolase [Pseudomonadota bacterium]
MIVALEDGQIHLVEQFRYPVGRRFWELPQGAVRDGAAPPLIEVAHAELAEETGLRAASMERIGRLHPAYGFIDGAYEVFLATGLTAGEANREAEEQDMITRAFPVGQVLEMITRGEIMDGVTVAALGLLRLQGRL